MSLPIVPKRTIMVTGGAGFIGSCFVRKLLAQNTWQVVNLDALTYASNLNALPSNHPSHTLVRGDIADKSLIAELLGEWRPQGIVHFAAESHVDRSIEGPDLFVQTNVVGTVNLLEATRAYFQALGQKEREGFRLVHISTDEVYGSLGPTGTFSEQSSCAPNSPYAASKAASDMFVRAFHKTYGLPTLITHSTNNYGPFQYPEKLVPVVIASAMRGKPIPVFGDGRNIRDWLYVDDNCNGILRVLEHGRVGQTYNIGGNNERTNLDVVNAICDLVDKLLQPAHAPCRNLIQHVPDRLGHDLRYAIDASKARNELGWSATTSFDQGLNDTVRWYLDYYKS
jgi:dTDP-glucose 4,6-dehydratase